MLTAAKNQLKVILLSVKYNIMREMTNRFTFLTNVIFMVLNNASFIVQWLVIFHLKKGIGGYELKDIMILWGLAASSYGLSHILFQQAYQLPGLIMNGKLDSFLVQPKNVLLSIISSGTNSSAFGDLVYGYLILFIFRFSLPNLLLFTYFSITGALIITAFAVITGSLSFWIIRGDIIAENLSNLMINFSIYPEAIFKGVVRLLFYTVIPVGFAAFLPLKVILHFNLLHLFAITGVAAFMILLAFTIFYRGLKRYTSSNLMSARI